LLDRSLIFATHTTLGLEASIQPTDAATTPVSLVIGYKRTDGVLNPVYHSDGIETPDRKTTTSKELDSTSTLGPGAAALVVLHILEQILAEKPISIRRSCMGDRDEAF
jgi:hypothetical protein